MLTELDVKSNPYTVRGVICFLNSLISKEVALSQLELNDDVYAALPLEEEYHEVILHIVALRLTLGMGPLFINPTTMDESLERNVNKSAKGSVSLRDLPAEFKRGESEY